MIKHIKYWWINKISHIKYSFEVFYGVLHGYHTWEGEPIKCQFCKCKRIDPVDYCRDDYGVVEVLYACANCKKDVALWSYGQWNYKSKMYMHTNR